MKKQRHKHQGGFRVPDNYMANLEDRILGDKLNEQDNLGRSSEDFKAHFKVPPAYFENLEERILRRTRRRVIRLPKADFRMLIVPVAASIALLIGLSYWNSASDSDSWTDLGDQDLYSIIADDYNIFSSDDIAEAFDDIDLESEIYAEMEIEGYLEEVDLENIIIEN